MKRIPGRHKYKKENKIKIFILEHIEKNLKDYAIFVILFIIGIICGVIFINNINETQYTEIEKYINNSIEIIKNNEQQNYISNLFFSLKNNMILVMLLWLFGMLIIGNIFIYSIVVIRGFLLGYTISSFIALFGIGKGILFSASSLLIQNIIFIPCLFIIAVSAKKINKVLINKQEKSEIKLQVIRHSITLGIVSIFLFFSSIVEIWVSRHLFIFSINWF